VQYAAAVTGEPVEKVAAAAWEVAEKKVGHPISWGLTSKQKREVNYAIYDHYRIFPSKESESWRKKFSTMQ
jgi:hypothetical protein